MMTVYGGVVGGDVGIGIKIVPHSGTVVCNTYILVRTGVADGVRECTHPEDAD